jgi:hypothetical protein
MKAEIEFLHCGEQLQKVVAGEISEIASVVDAVKWSEVFEPSENNTVSQHQTAYNKALARNFRGLGWETFLCFGGTRSSSVISGKEWSSSKSNSGTARRYIETSTSFNMGSGMACCRSQS